jgi:transmembrane sensor
MEEKDAQRLLDKFKAGECTEEEKIRLRNWFNTVNNQQDAGLSKEELETTGNELWSVLERQTKPAQVRRLWPRLTAAASILLVIGVSAYFITNHQHQQPKANTHDVAPFTGMAILKTGGKTILLDKTGKGLIAQRNNTTITKAQDEQLVYTAGNGILSEAVYDTIQVPAGGRPYTVKLSDGSKITLNAASALRYPENFSATKRSPIELITGEVYAEIAHNKKAPLQFLAPKQRIEDIGTTFDISAYPDDPDSRTTLIEGSLKVNKTRIKPGQQAVLTTGNLYVSTANIDQVTAWKNGDFSFNGEHIDAIMRQLARWYNIEVKYEGKKTDEVFYGRITRKKNISEVLHMLEKTQKIHFKVEGRRVTVLSKD